jgi:hypothetical protein
MLATKRRQRTLADLKRDIENLQSELEKFLEDRVAEQKLSPSGRDLPTGWLRADIFRGECLCEAAKRLIDND